MKLKLFGLKQAGLPVQMPERSRGMVSGRTYQAGYTLIEIVIVMAIIGIATVTLIVAFQSNTKVERFSGNLKEMANNIQEQQTGSYSITTDLCGGSPCNTFWRGTLLEYREGDPSYAISLLYGDDISRFSTDQKLGLRGKRLQETFNYEDRGIVLEDIEVVSGGLSIYPTEVSLAFLAPDGKSFAANQIYTSFDPTLPIYSAQNIVKIHFRDGTTELLGTIVFNPANGSTETELK